MFQEVMQRGNEAEQISAIDELAFLSGRSVRRALIGIVGDVSMLVPVRERASEMLHLQPHRETLEASVSGVNFAFRAKLLQSRPVTLRFWAAYTLGNLGFSGTSLGAVAASALETVLGDQEVAPGWWSVGREAQALIPVLGDDSAERQRLQVEIRSILQDPDAPPEDWRSADWYAMEYLLPDM